MREGLQILKAVHRRWQLQRIAVCIGAGVSAGLLGGALLHSTLWGAVVFAAGLAVALMVSPRWDMADTVRVLDREVQSMEESTGLLLREEMGMLERMQAERVGARLGEARLPRPMRRRLIVVGAMMVVIGVIVAGGGSLSGHGKQRAGNSEKSAAIRKMAAMVGNANVRVTPPAYTRHAMRAQSGFDLEVEEGALLRWDIHMTAMVDSLQLVFNDSMRVELHTSDGLVWSSGSLQALSGFYQVKVNGRLLPELYKLVVIPDEAPRITIKTPKPYTTIDMGESRDVSLTAVVQDDYGISDAAVVATVATGSGEAVKFREETFPFEKGFNGVERRLELRRLLRLEAMGVHPGDELYFYCRAKDSRGQEVRTDMYIISLPDTAKLMSLEGLTTGVDIKPELFRSQRQIIIETEQLLKARDTVSVKAFNDKSGDLGTDEKLLRLRYGRFLGEEAEEGDSREAFDAAGGSAGDFGDAAKVKDAFTDKHDNAEDATFFEPAIKQQLKATLTEMWNAELRLRTYQPREALAYEYKALRLLKDLQQKSRAYVAKTGVKVTSPDPKKRLTGELGQVQAPKRAFMGVAEPSEEDKLRMVLSVLEMPAVRRGAGDQALLQLALRRLGQAATARPAVYLEGFQALKATAAGREASPIVAQQAIRKLLSLSLPRPTRPGVAADDDLSNIYFKEVSRP